MIDPGSLHPVTEAVLLIGVVLAEAIVLYLGYGLAERALSDRVIERIKQS